MSKLAQIIKTAMLRPIATAVVLSAALACTPSFAAPWAEAGDAGQTQDTAQNTWLGINPLSSIAGGMGSSTDVDLYKIYISDFASFSATTVGGSDLDTQLFLFTAGGAAIYMNDDDLSSGWIQSTLPARHGLGPTSNGWYLLGISLSGNDPVNGNNDLLFNDGLTTDVRGPVDQISPALLADFTGQTLFVESGAYDIQLTGVTGAAAEVPEPSTGLLAALALALGGFMKRRSGRRTTPSTGAVA